MPIEIDLPVTEDGNDPADYDQATLDALNREVDARVSGIGLSEAKAYIALYETLKARVLIRSEKGITCSKTNKHYEACLKVVGGGQ